MSSEAQDFLPPPTFQDPRLPTELRPPTNWERIPWDPSLDEFVDLPPVDIKETQIVVEGGDSGETLSELKKIFGSTTTSPVCDSQGVQVRTGVDFARLIAPVLSATPIPEEDAALVDFRAPEGEPADSETTAAVEDTLRKEAACFNAGQDDVAFAYSTDNRIRHEPSLLTVPNLDHIDFVEVIDVKKLEDGRVGANCVYDLTPGGRTSKYCYFQWSNSNWLIDETVDLVRDSGG